MAAQLLLINPSRPRRRLRSSFSWGAPTQARPRLVLGRTASASAASSSRHNPKKKKHEKGSTMAKRRHSRKRRASRAVLKALAKARRARSNPRRRKYRKNPHLGGKRKYRKAGLAKVVSGTMKSPKRRRKRAKKGSTGSSMASKKRKSSGKRKSAKRVAAGKKAARTRKAKAAARKAAAKKGHRKHRKHRKSGPRRRRRMSFRRINRALKKTNSVIKSIRKRKKKGKRSKALQVWSARRSALRVKKAMARRKYPKSVSRKARAFGLHKVNPSMSMSSLGKDLMAVLPDVGVAMVSVAVVGLGTQKLSAALAGKLPAALVPYEKALYSSALTVGAWAAAGWVPQLSKYKGAILMGGAAWVALELMKAVQVGGMSLSAKMGIPALGDYAVGDYAVGDYTAMGDVIDVDGHAVAVGAGIFGESSLGALPDPRDGSRGTLNEPHIVDMLSEEVDGSLSGSIFD